ncbi:tyrosine-type recombinase/integrase [Paucidesulfovibrio longus]|uniref:tyrosine-type recombinase/integrase n=1 Tax=Paucidesulfovibrio longus TaxID=889 RepID=UPI0003B376DD|nr:integrase arm-type DNA-binding domain-containing protein [Paucidesulfovibrio longus]
MKLNALKVNSAKPQSKAFKLFDGGGLFLLVTPNGSKLWRLKYRLNGKEKLLALGAYPQLSLAAAREARDKARKLLAGGTDPSLAKKQERASQAETVADVAREWHEVNKSRWTPDHAGRIWRRLEKDLFPLIGNRPTADVSPAELLEAIRTIEKRGTAYTARRALQDIKRVFSYAVVTSRAQHNPATDLSVALKQPPVQHRAAATEVGPLRELLRAIEGYLGTHVVKCALRLLPHVFCRPGELRFMEWTELDLESPEPTWSIPAEKMKMRRKHIVPLSRQATAILKEVQPLTESGRYVFPCERTRAQPMSNNALNAALRRMGFSKEEVCAHGFRATAATLLAEMGYPSHLVEIQLSHADRNKVRAAYNHAEYLPERRKMMIRWSDFLDRVQEGGKVVPLFRAG